ncbi:S-methyl-5'-thioadenosine phosphorylase-like [Tropilaelaps mercedesae]|uniref:S-methyl-5'-thioadenosine phosphorylase n=1 Tax=Tropilaelaps mercedesae TaxID=418985 RepID=A0A1V9XPP1_9ACAR|nr:S-methyl-5'-thioadenosine phosphorylase-like [Tropilaelaps mercedesae]
MAKIGIIGGSGLERPDLLKQPQEKYVKTPYGEPSDALITGKINEIDVVILSRHGRRHTINPSNVNYRANLFALKLEGCTHILVTTACGSLKEEVRPGNFMTPDSFIDRTHRRTQTFYDGQQGEGRLKGVCHLPMTKPFCEPLSDLLSKTAVELGYVCHPKGVVVCIEGPRFSTRAESAVFRQWGADLVNMTIVPEVVLAQELGIPYAALAIATDYDCWSNDTVDVQKVMATLKKAADEACHILKTVLPKIHAYDWSKINKGLDEQLNIAVMHTDS